MAVSADTLLASCQAVEGRPRVGLVRHNKYRIAGVTPDAAGQICRLTVAEGPLTPTAGYRSFADLRVGEPVVALASRTSAEVAAAPGWLAGKGAADDPFLEATPTVPAGNRSAVLIDGFGNLIDLGAAAPVAGGLVLAVPIGSAATADLANRDLGEADVLLAALTPAPRAQPRQPAILLPVGSDYRNGNDRAPPAPRSVQVADDGGSAPAPAAGPTRGSGGGTPAGGSDGGGTASGGTTGDGGSAGDGGGAATDPGTDTGRAGGTPDGAPTAGGGPAVGGGTDVGLGVGGVTGVGVTGVGVDVGVGGVTGVGVGVGIGGLGRDVTADADGRGRGRGRGRGGGDRDGD